eukprot:1006734-Lingulodinium_polyedra.AAC.1
MSAAPAKRLCARRHVQQATIGNFREVVGQQAMKKQTDVLLQTIMQHLKENPDKIWAVHGMITGEKAAPAEKTFSRGVRRIIGVNKSDGVPQYALMEALHEMCGTDRGALSGMANIRENLMLLVAYGCHQQLNSVLPNLKMTQKDFVAWTKERHL